MPQEILQAAAAFVAALVAAVSPIAIAYVTRWLKSKLTAQQLEVARTLAIHSVQVAEELGNQTGASGRDKLAVAARTFKSLADGVSNFKKLDQEAVYDLIHSALVEFRLLNEPADAGLDLSELLEGGEVGDLVTQRDDIASEEQPEIEVESITSTAAPVSGKAPGSDTGV